jgi:hypothetical protein
MRGKLGLSAVVGAIVALAVLVLGVPFASGTQQGGGRGAKTIRLTATEVAFNYLDLGDKGPTLGEQIVFADTLSHAGKMVGEDGGTCTVTRVVSQSGLTTHCVATLSLRYGQITVQGLVTFREGSEMPFTVAVTGGTGAYRSAGGELRVIPVSETVERYVLSLDLP